MKKSFFTIVLVAMLATAALAQGVDLLDPWMPPQLNGAAEWVGKVVYLSHDKPNDRASLFSQEPWAINRSFVLTGTFLLTRSTRASYTADGVAICFQRQGATALGALGQGMGFYGIQNGACLAFRNYRDNFPPGPTQTSKWAWYRTSYRPAGDASDAYPLMHVDLNDNKPKHLWVWYDHGSRMLDFMIYNHASEMYDWGSIEVDLPRVLGGNYAYVGATAGTATFSQGAAVLELSIWPWF